MIYTIYLDLNRDGKFDAGDPSFTPTESDPTDVSNLMPGVYRVWVKPDPGYRLIGPSSYTVRVGAKHLIAVADFRVRAIGKTITGVVFYDPNHNGKQDRGEGSLAGWS